MKNLLLFGLLALLISSCAFHSGMMTGNASIANNNFRVVKIIDGQASTTHILGIGGLSKSALVLEAKKDMLTNYPLRKGQALANVTVDIKKTFVLFYEKTLITVSADVIDFNPMDTEEEFEDVYLFYNPNAHVGFKVGDTVYVMTNEYAMTLDKGYVSGFGQKRLEVVYTNGYSNYYYSHVLHATKTEDQIRYYGYEIGQEIEYIATNDEIKRGVIFCINSKYAGVKEKNAPEKNFKWDLIPLGRIRTL